MKIPVLNGTDKPLPFCSRELQDPFFFCATKVLRDMGLPMCHVPCAMCLAGANLTVRGRKMGENKKDPH